MATVTPNFNWPVPTSTDLVKDGATAIEALGDSIDASLVDLKGGTTGQVLSKNSNTDMDFVWVTDAAGDITGVTAGTGISGGGTSGTVTVTNSMATAIDAKGDLVPGTGADTFARLAVGANGTVLTADSAETTGLKWVAPAAGAFVGVLCKKGATQTISNTTDTVLNFSGTDHYDTDGFHDPATNNSRITIPTGLGGYYLVYGLNTWDTNATGRRFCELKKNGTKIFTSNGFGPNSTAAPSNMISIVLNLSAGDYVEYQVWQSSGGNLDTFGNDELTWFGVAKL
jgi:hypothetical protein